jgi:Kdo2-lipid IVA lauroyltransferase/acyltransferase
LNRRDLEDRLASSAGVLASFLGRRASLALGRSLGRLLGDLDHRHMAIALDNLRHAFPDWDEPRLLRTARAVYAHFGQVVFDILWMRGRSREVILSVVEVQGGEHVQAAMAEGRGAIMATAHIGNWELHGVAHGWLFGPIGVVARALDNPALDRRLCELRTQGGNAVFYKKRALAQVLKALRGGGATAILIDQNVQEKDGIFVDFFGRPAATTTVAAALAVKTGCLLVPSHSEIRPDGGYRLIYDPPIRWKTSGDREADISRLTQELTARIEEWVRETPGQWLWIHRRWKTRPGTA